MKTVQSGRSVQQPFDDVQVRHRFDDLLGILWFQAKVLHRRCCMLLCSKQYRAKICDVMLALDSSYQCFRSIRDEYGDLSSIFGANEAEVRVRLIDRILFECLGWPRQAGVEVSVEDRRPDYVLRDEDGRNWVIVEAKRANFRLVNPDGRGKDGRQKFKLSGAAFSFGKSGKEGAWRVFSEQIVLYGAKFGTAIGIATNGTQWVGAAVPSRSGRGLADESAVVFASLDAILAQYDLFFNYFSISNIASLSLAKARMPMTDWLV